MKRIYVLPIFVLIYSLFVSCTKDDEIVIEPISVSSILPSSNATDVSVDAIVTIMFSREFSSATSVIKLVAPDKTEVDCEKTISGTSVTLKSKSLLDPGETYSIYVKVSTVDGATVENTSKFTTKAETLKWVSVIPAFGAINVELDVAVSFKFNKKLKSNVVDKLTIMPYPGEKWTTTYDGDKTVTMSCSTALKANSKYELLQLSEIEALTGTDKLTLPKFSFTTRN